MDFQLNKNLGKWRTQVNGKTVDKIFQVDFNKDRYEDIYLPWLFFITFVDFNKFLEIEGDFDGDHVAFPFLVRIKSRQTFISKEVVYSSA